MSEGEMELKVFFCGLGLKQMVAAEANARREGGGSHASAMLGSKGVSYKA